MTPPLRVATRGSALARRQTDLVIEALGVPAEVVVVEAVGDRRTDVPISVIGGQGVFVKEVQAAVLDGRADLAVHSAKDLPSRPVDGLVIATVPLRADPRDALVGSTLDGLPVGGRVGTGAVRRRAQLAYLRPDLVFGELRGNIGTRLSKASSFDAIVVAAAALVRLDRLDAVSQFLDPAVFVPQVGQGALAVECRVDDAATRAALAAIDHEPSHRALRAERAFLAEVGGDCELPVGAYATVMADGRLALTGILAELDGRAVARHSAEGRDPDELGRAVARRVVELERGLTVYLVGAGPGDPGLITVRGAELLRAADVVIHDRLSDASLLDLAPPSAERIDVGKSPGGPVDQDQINVLLVERGRAGQEVVRLKGGDPFVFGRGGEEAAALIEAGVPFEVVPGITSAIAVPAYAGVPVTHRGLSTSFTVVTGHSRHSADSDIDWASLARAGGTLVVLMGIAHRAELAAALVEGGMAPDTPVAAVRWGTRPAQQTVRTTLDRLPDLVLEPPVTMVIGKVAALDLRWFENRPLLGRRIVVCRAAHQASALVERLRRLGAEAIEVPTIEIVDPDDDPAADGAGLASAAATVRDHDWVAFTSTNAVERFFACVRDARALGDVKVAAIGPGTAAALAQRGVAAELTPDTSVAEALVDALVGHGGGPARILLPQAAAARAALADGLRAAGWQVTTVVAYRTRPVTPAPDLLAAAAKADAIAFTSSSTVENYLDAAGPDAVPATVVCIGPVTAETARGRGLTVAAVAEQHNLDGLVSALVAVATPH